MTQTRIPQQHLIPQIVLTIVVLAMAALYLTSSLNATGTPNPIMPLDDTYIHFQYAQAIAQGHPMRYNPDQPPTSGATSLLYPALLAVGYIIGFSGERLSWWALAIGVLSWIGSTLALYQIAVHRGSRWIAFSMALTFALTGSLGWAFMSGMETGLMVLMTLLVLWYVVEHNYWHVILTGTIAALIRPEGLIVALLAWGYFIVLPRGFYVQGTDAATVRSETAKLAKRLYYATKWRFRLIGLFVILLAGLLQPAINWLATGSAAASGMIAKSYVYNVPNDTGVLLNNIVTVIGRSIEELVTGYSRDDGMYYLFLLPLLAGIAILIGVYKAWKTRQIRIELLILSWIIALIGMVSLLETAFWQFKRYQQPIIVLLFPLAAWLITTLYRGQRQVRLLAGVLTMILVIAALFTPISYHAFYVTNVNEVAKSQREMALYVAENIPQGAFIGVHDIGVMRYLGNHATYDVVGLTTPGAARAWRNGPGSMFEQMVVSPYRPSYFAIYPDARGLTYLANTGLFREQIAHFPSTQPSRNVASATSSGQYVYKADWTFAAYASQIMQPSIVRALQGLELVDSVNVANLDDEDKHSYRWWQIDQRHGFPTEFYEQKYIDCQPDENNATCTVLDGGRLITGGEVMTIRTVAGQDLLWVTRVHGRSPIKLAVYVNGKQIGTRVVPNVPGQWLEIASYIPGEQITSEQTTVRIDADGSAHYMPYYHWFYQGEYQPEDQLTLPEFDATFGKGIALIGREITYDESMHTVRVQLAWRGAQQNVDAIDAVIFVHLYDRDDKLITQTDRRVGNGTMPPANWLPGIILDTYEIAVPVDVVAGEYQVAIGLYDPVQPDLRIPIAENKGDKDNRLWIGAVDIK